MSALLTNSCATCNEDALYYCRLCSKHYCFEHLCTHLQSAQDTAPSYRRMLDEVACERNDCDSTALKSFKEYSEDELKSLPEMQLRSRMQRMLSEAKRVQRELERRMIYSAELTGVARHKTYPAAAVTTHATKKIDPDALARKREREQKKQQNIKSALDVLAQAIKSGIITPEQLRKKV